LVEAGGTQLLVLVLGSTELLGWRRGPVGRLCVTPGSLCGARMMTSCLLLPGFVARVQHWEWVGMTPSARL
jgi:hypothetical protein